MAGIAVMIGNKLILIKKGQAGNIEEIPLKVPNLDEVRKFSVHRSRKYGYIVLVMTIRVYIKISNFLKKAYKSIKLKINKLIRKYFPGKIAEPKEKQISKFLKMISEYKNKIKRLKEKIEEEEKNY